jgi:competence protein ComEC
MGGTDRAQWPLAAWSLAVLGGAALQLQQAALGSATTYLALAAGGVAAVAFGAFGAWRAGRGPMVSAVAIGLGLAALVFAATGWRAQERLAERLPAALEGRDLALTGVVAELPRNLPDGVRFVFAVEGAALEGRPVTLPARVSLGWYRGFGDDEARLLEPFTTLRAGQRWQFTARLKQPHGTRNPHGFDYELWAFEQGLGAAGYVRATERVPARLLNDSAGYPVERARQSIRDAIVARVADARTAGMLAALVVGDQAAIERADWELFRTTGIAHLVSISGLHVTMFAWLAGAVIAALWRRSARAVHRVPAPLAGRWGGLAAAAAYALLAGWGVPASSA